MSLDEKVFYHLWKLREKMTKQKVPSYACQFEQVENTFGTFASLIAGELVKIKKGKEAGGMVGDTLFLPPHIALSRQVEENQKVYIHNVCFAVTAKNLGYELDYQTTTPFKRLLATLVAAPTILSEVAKSYPVFFSEFRPLFENFWGRRGDFSAGSSETAPAIVNNYCFDIVGQVLYESKSSDEVFATAQKGNLKIAEIANLSHKLEPRFKDGNLKTPVSIPPFFSLLPLGGLLQFHKSHQTVHESERTDSPETIIQADPKDIVKRVELNEDENYNPASILMESVQSVDLFCGGLKRVDGSDELDEHQEGLEELEVKEVVRTSRDAKSIFQADIAYELVSDEQEDGVFEKNPNLFFYDEWNYRKRKYLSNWCQLYEVSPTATNLQGGASEYLDRVRQENAKEIRELRGRLEHLMVSRRWKTRQMDGEDIDIDSLVDGLSSIRGGKSPDERFYLSKPKKNQDVSVLILLDASLSSDSWIEGRRVLDVSKEAIVVIQEAVEGLFDQVSIMAFNGKTRQKCNYEIVKEFDMPWKSSLSNLLAIEPAGYTRIGTALRHSLSRMNRVNSTKKVIVLVSDGKPTDYDVYEGKYGIHDVRQVVREAKQQGVQITSLAIDQQAKYYFPQMFGRNNFKVLKHPKQLASHFLDLFVQLI